MLVEKKEMQSMKCDQEEIELVFLCALKRNVC